MQATLPDNVLYITQAGKLKGGSGTPTFTRAGQTLTWTGVNLEKKGAGFGLKLKVNVTNCADGRLEFNAFTTAGPSCMASANPSSTTVRHAKGWAACPPP